MICDRFAGDYITGLPFGDSRFPAPYSARTRNAAACKAQIVSSEFSMDDLPHHTEGGCRQGDTTAVLGNLTNPALLSYDIRHD